MQLDYKPWILEKCLVDENKKIFVVVGGGYLWVTRVSGLGFANESKRKLKY